jgi:hypothetical protein
MLYALGMSAVKLFEGFLAMLVLGILAMIIWGYVL